MIAVRHGQIGESDKMATCPLSTTLVSVCRGRHTPLTRAPRAGLRRDSQCYHILPGGRCLSRLSAATAPSLGPPPPRWCSAAFCVPPPHAPPADAPPRTENLRLFCRACGAASQAPMPCEWRLFGTRSLVWGAGSKTFACVGFWVFMWVAGGVPSLMWVGRSLMWASGCSPGRLGGPGARVWAALVWSMRRHRQRLCVRVSGMWSIGRSCGPLTLMWSVSSGHVVYACSCGRSPSLRWPMSLAHVGPA